MVFQPISPIRYFHQRVAKRGRSSPERQLVEAADMSTKQTSGMISSRPTSKALSQADTMVSSDSSETSKAEIRFPVLQDAGIVDQITGAINVEPTFPDHLKARRESIGTTNSSPTDPAYIPAITVPGSKPVDVDSSQSEILGKASRPIGQSFFDSDSEYSEDDSPVVGRASSVRISTPQIIQHHLKSNGQAGIPVGQRLSTSVDVTSSRSSQSDVESNVRSDSTVQLNGTPSPLKVHNGDSTDQTSTVPTSLVPQEVSEVCQENVRSAASSPPPAKTIVSGLDSNPVTEKDRTTIYKMDTSSLPQDKTRHVKIRPSDLIVTHAKDNPRFRESIVTTPYPGSNKLVGELYSQAVEIVDDDVSLTAFPQKIRRRDVTPQSAGNDRFPSPHHPEILFLDLSLAKHPSITTTVEIKIADKGRYDDEMLFGQIRSAYFKHLLGWSRILFYLIRGFSHVTVNGHTGYSDPISEAKVSTSFDALGFLRHLCNPRIGSKRKVWIIWLRNQNRQLVQCSPRQDADHFAVHKRPLASYSTDRRPSAHSESTSSSTSNFNLSIFPPLSTHRIPFFRERLSAPVLSSAAAATITGEDKHYSETKNVPPPPNNTPDQSIQHTLFSKCTAVRPFHNPTKMHGSDSVITTTTSSDDCVPHSRVKIEVHHKFNFWTMALLFLLSLTMSILSTVTWIVFGDVQGLFPSLKGGITTTTTPVIGTTAGHGPIAANLFPNIGRGGTITPGLNWQVYYAQQRVLTGLVLGLVVLLMSILVEGAVVVGGLLLL